MRSKNTDVGLRVVPAFTSVFLLARVPGSNLDRAALEIGRLPLGGYPPRAAVFNAPPKFFITSEIALESA